MDSSAAVVDKEEQIKWWDALYAFHKEDWELGLELARESRHPDAQWLAALFPSDVEVTRQRMSEVLLAQREDPRGLLLAWRLTRTNESKPLLRRAAELGYAPAQVEMSTWTLDRVEMEKWAQLAASQSDRSGIYLLAVCAYNDRSGMPEARAKAIALYKQSAELGFPPAEFAYGQIGFAFSWELFHWYARAAAHGFNRRFFGDTVAATVPSFEKGENAKILLTVAPLIRANLDVAGRTLLGKSFSSERIDQLQRVVKLQDNLLRRVTRAIMCWSQVARRLRVVKDIRVMIAKMAWEDAWAWGKATAKKPKATKKARWEGAEWRCGRTYVDWAIEESSSEDYNW
jgi:hypothetical protein